MQEILDLIKAGFDALITYIIEALKSFCEWILDFFLEGINLLLTQVIDLIPDLSGFWSRLSWMSEYTVYLNKWLALDTLVMLSTAYFVFILSMIAVKLIIKLFIPTVG